MGLFHEEGTETAAATLENVDVTLAILYQISLKVKVRLLVVPSEKSLSPLFFHAIGVVELGFRDGAHILLVGRHGEEMWEISFGQFI